MRIRGRAALHAFHAFHPLRSGFPERLLLIALGSALCSHMSRPTTCVHLMRLDRASKVSLTSQPLSSGVTLPSSLLVFQPRQRPLDLTEQRLALRHRRRLSQYLPHLLLRAAQPLQPLLAGCSRHL